MTDMHAIEIAAILAVFLLAGLVKGITGMGLPTVAMGLLGAVLSPVVAASLMLAPSLATNLWQAVAGPAFGTVLLRLWPMLAAILLLTPISTALLTGAGSGLSSALLGLVLALYALWALAAPPLALRAGPETWLKPLGGAATGVITGATGIFVIPAAPMLQALGFDRDALVQALGLSFTVSTLSLGLGLLIQGGMGALPDGDPPITLAMLSVAAILPAFLGMEIGRRIRGRIAPDRFRHWFLVSMLVLGLEMVSRVFR